MVSWLIQAAAPYLVPEHAPFTIAALDFDPDFATAHAHRRHHQSRRDGSAVLKAGATRAVDDTFAVMDESGFARCRRSRITATIAAVEADVRG